MTKSTEGNSGNFKFAAEEIPKAKQKLEKALAQLQRELNQQGTNSNP